MKASANTVRSRLLMVIDNEIKVKNPARRESHKNYRIRFTESFSSSPIEESHLSHSEKIEIPQLKEGSELLDAKKSQKYLRQMCLKFKRDQPLRKKYQSGNLSLVMKEYKKDTNQINHSKTFNEKAQRKKEVSTYKKSLFKIQLSDYYNVQLM